ncbi:hypothetical protein [Sphingomonas hengshuiensis]|uniref:hypothetical protein n=1 Tax=Sphingomonas hengshuiensis TaxID=1609977 RepID=UPI000A6C7396|nr:hypothetical protein [Sphingomonas hengshuiensis]
MKLRQLAIAFGVLASGGMGATMLAAAAVSTQAAPPPAGPGLDLINERCGFCHTTAQVLTVRKTPQDWAIVVQSMIDRGAELSPEEQKTVDAYLAANYALPAPGATAPAAAPTGAR